MPRKRSSHVSKGALININRQNRHKPGLLVGLGVPEPETVNHQPEQNVAVGNKEFCATPDNMRKSSLAKKSEEYIFQSSPRITDGPNPKPSPGSGPRPTTIDVLPLYVLAEVNSLNELFRGFPCKICKLVSLKLDVTETHAFAHKINVVCRECGVIQSSCYSSSRSHPNQAHATSTRPEFDVNKKVVQAFVSMGKGYAGMEKFCMSVGTNCMSSATFHKHQDQIHKYSSIACKTLFNEVRKKVRQAYMDLDITLTEASVINICVSYDGSWHKRGFTSKFGVGIVIDLLTGFVIDFVVLSKFCLQCCKAKKLLGEKTIEFTNWAEKHNPSCQMNYTGSSPGMEMFAADILWKRSLEYNLRYTTLLSDGDSKTFNHLVSEEVYGPGIVLVKEECTNHIAKRLGTGLRNLVKDNRKQGLTLGGKTHGSLKEDTIVKLTRYYSNAIKNNSNDIVSMKTAIFSTLYHCMSTDVKPQHEKCPLGPSSWCFYQRAVAKNETPGSHMTNIHTPLSQAVVLKLIPVYQRLAGDELLQRCLPGRTQNANESLHSRIWLQCPKHVFASKRRVEAAVQDAISEFNNGTFTAVGTRNKAAQVSMSPISANIMKRRDMRRTRQMVQRVSQKYQSYRLAVRIAQIRAEECKKKVEGETYAPGGF